MIRKPTGRPQTFCFAAPEASQVLLVGDFTQWSARPVTMRKDPDGLWRATVILEPGSYSYRYIADGEWRDDPECPVRAANPYGSQNAVREVA